ncbi:MAG: sodium:calcium antiporter [Chitinophagales bacterium]|nr:sodium:calcium antiporter [Chitinophagales bacterium]
MNWEMLLFVPALAVLLFSARLFTRSAVLLGAWMRLPEFVIGIFIVGIGTSLPELISGVLAVLKGSSEIIPGNVIGANIANLLMVTGFAVAINRKPITLGSSYINIDLHFMLGGFFVLFLIAHDGQITFSEGFFGLVIFVLYSVFLIRGGEENPKASTDVSVTSFPKKAVALLLGAAVGIYFGAEYTVRSIGAIAVALQIPPAIIALTVLSLGTTLPELVVNISAIRDGKAEMAIGNILGSCVFNTLVIPGVTSAVGVITVPVALVSFSLPVMGAAGIFFYLITQDKKISVWEGLMFVFIYLLFLMKTAVG